MTATDTIIDLDIFSRIRQTLYEVTNRPSRSVEEAKATEWYLSGSCGKERVGTTFGDLPIEALRARDELRTYNGSAATVQVVDKINSTGVSFGTLRELFQSEFRQTLLGQ